MTLLWGGKVCETIEVRMPMLRLGLGEILGKEACGDVTQQPYKQCETQTDGDHRQEPVGGTMFEYKVSPFK